MSDYLLGFYNSAMKDAQEIFVDNLVAIRKAKGISQMALCEKANIANGLITEIETKHRNPNLSTIQKIASALKVPVYQLFVDTEEQIGLKPELSKEAKKHLIAKLVDEISK